VLDGRDIQSLNLRWLRRQISLVGQEPVLFDTTIFDNIRYGITNSSQQRSDKEIGEQVIDAAKKAYAHDFIMNLPDTYQTRVGEKGVQLSGGQRQRIAIARALINDPKILLLDEATSALDSKSESVVQRALDVAAKHRTTIMIAHRLSTVRNADKIVVLSRGVVAEQGTHNELISRNGVYASLVQKQDIESPYSADSITETSERESDSEYEISDTTLVSDKEGSATFFPEHTETAMTSEPPVKAEDQGRLTLWQTLRFIARMNREETVLLVIGLGCAIVAGFGIPVFVPPFDSTPPSAVANSGIGNQYYLLSYSPFSHYQLQSMLSSEERSTFGPAYT
jgi:ATP-binding cassette subfamily B (MDR/TAP) protein 1